MHGLLCGCLGGVFGGLDYPSSSLPKLSVFRHSVVLVEIWCHDVSLAGNFLFTS